MRTDNPEGIINQLSDVRRHSLRALDCDLDELEQRVDPYLETWRSVESVERRRQGRMREFMNSVPVLRDPPNADGHTREDIAVSLAWFPAGEYEEAINRWPSLAEEWADVPHADYCALLDGNIKWMRSHGVPIRAITPIVVDEYAAWCEEHDEDPEEARADHCQIAGADRRSRAARQGRAKRR